MNVTENIYWTITGKIKNGQLKNMNNGIEALLIATRNENGAL